MKRIKKIVSILCIVVMLPCTIALADTGYGYSTDDVKKFVDELILGLVDMSDDELAKLAPWSETIQEKCSNKHE